MSQLTSTARKTYLGLLSANILIIFAVMVLGQYFYYANSKPLIAPATIHSLGKVVHFLKDKPEFNWSKFVNKHGLSWAKMTLTKEPVFKDNSLLNFQPAIVNDNKFSPK